MPRLRLTRGLQLRARANARSSLEAAQRRREDLAEAQAAVDDAAADAVEHAPPETGPGRGVPTARTL